MNTANTIPNAVEFVKSLPLMENFAQALPMSGYVPLPDDWYIAVTDVVESRKAIAAGLFKPVNMAGVGIISAVMNTLGHQDIPYIFSGDGAAIACSPQEKDKIELAMEQTVAWVEDDLELELRASMVPVAAVRALGFDIRVSAIRVSDAITNFAFSGGGVSRAEAIMKDGGFRIHRKADTIRPNLAGLSCRWTAVGEDDAKMVSMIVEPPEDVERVSPEILASIMDIVRGHSDEGNPMPKDGPGFVWPTALTGLESKATGESKLSIYLTTLLALFLFKTGLKLGGFDAKHYWRTTSLNTDYRKIQDGLRMTVSLSLQELTALRAKLEGYRAEGKIRFGLCEQDKAVLTCYVPSATSDNHFHFLDGSGGGYAAAADDLH